MLKELNKKYNPISNFKIVVCNDGNIFLDKIEKKSKDWTNSVLAIVPLRLGLKYIEPEYLDCITEIFNFNSNVGISGGREHAALYFMGLVQSSMKKSDFEPKLVYLDPHFVHTSIPSKKALAGNIEQNIIQEYHCTKMRQLPISKMCTSLAVGFYIRDSEAYDLFKLKMLAL